ncbi:MAG: efflux RND transporter periplasmic adaptor subunit [Steroidobacteraceae bacterium]|nr:efflux RND transporter periplasmic adaptor subunit [Steroidobacteraceae bacterium]MDW8258791.1 efflux RND transporter periplasmic adaptor subunit [Gammaproteobacteria bacterium]
MKDWLDMWRTKCRENPWYIALGVFVIVVLWVGSGVVFPKKRVPDQPAPPPGPAELPELVVERLPLEPVERVVSLSARIEPARTVQLKAETSGRVVATGAARGSRVAAGSVIVRLDTGERLARLAQARATLKQREFEYAGVERLKPQGYISDAKIAESAALLEAARAELRRAELDVERMTIRAPFAGALQERNVEIGDYVAPGTLVATVVDERTLVATANVAESQAVGIRRGLKGTARLSTGQTVDGVVRYVAPVADPATRTFRVELEIPNANAQLPVGVTAEVDLPLGRVEAHRLSPALLTLDDTGTVGVKIVATDQTVQFVPVRVVRSSTDGVWVQGLPPDAAVITGGQGYVKPGQRVRAQLATAS